MRFLKSGQKSSKDKEKQITLEGHFGKADLKSGRVVTPGHVSSFGVPITLHIEKIREHTDGKI